MEKKGHFVKGGNDEGGGEREREGTLDVVRVSCLCLEAEISSSSLD